MRVVNLKWPVVNLKLDCYDTFDSKHLIYYFTINVNQAPYALIFLIQET